MSKFNELFKHITPERMTENVFTLAEKGLPVITAGNKEHYNSMTGSGGGLGLLFKKPVTWLLVRADRYTLELIQKEKTYTVSYFPSQYTNQVIFLGSKSGRDSEKMKDVELTMVQTPSDNITFKEAKLIFECKLTQITTPELDDFYTQESKEYLEKVYKNKTHYRKYVFGEITSIWAKE